MRIPADTREFAINASNQRFWEAPVRRYVEECLQGKEGLHQRVQVILGSRNEVVGGYHHR